MKLETDTIELSVQGIKLDNGLHFSNMQTEIKNASFNFEKDFALEIPSISIGLTLTENAMNSFLENLQIPNTDSLQVSMIDGLLRIGGRYKLRFLPAISFAMDCALAVDNLQTVKINPITMQTAGFHLPESVMHYIIEKINNKLEAVLDLRKLPMKLETAEILHLTGRTVIKVEGSLNFGKSQTKNELKPVQLLGS
jgi:hypothetical protein